MHSKHYLQKHCIFLSPVSHGDSLLIHCLPEYVINMLSLQSVFIACYSELTHYLRKRKHKDINKN